MIDTSVGNAFLNDLFGRGGKTYPLPTASECWIGVSTTTPSIGGSGTITGFTEPAASTGYARTLLGKYNQSGTYVMSAAANSSITNGQNFIFFDEAKTGGGGFGTVTYFGLFSAKTGGTPILAGQLTTSVTVAEGNVLIFRPNNLTVSMD